MKLTEEQQRALDLTQNISVTAGAGAGKTRLLVERFLEMALNYYKGRPYQVRKILAITFTNKAAGEMRERIALALHQRLQDVPEGAERNHLLGVRDQLNSVAISTIHSFCARILREYPIEAQLPPDFSELDEMQSSMLINEAIEQVFKRVNEASDERERAAYLELFQYFEPRKIRALLRQALKQPFEMSAVVEQFRQFNDEQAYLDFVGQLWIKAIRQLWPQSHVQQVVHIAVSLLHRLSEQPKEKAIEKHFQLQQLARLGSGNPWQTTDYALLLEALRSFTGSKGQAYKTVSEFGGKYSWQKDAEPLLLQLSELSARLLSRFNTFDPGQPPDEADRLYYHLFKTILEMYDAARQIYENLKAEIPGVDFEDLLLKTWQLLKNNEDVRQELLKRFEFIMVDEFQDTNALQWQIIELLATEDGRLQSNKIFVVGDPKQSIYGFRNADIRIFKAVKEALAHNAGLQKSADYPGNLILKNSFRFLPRLNAFINDLFKDLLQPSAENIYEVEFEPLVAQRTVQERGHLELAILREEDQLSEEEYLAQTIDRLVRRQPLTCHERQGQEEVERPLRFGDIAILLRSRNALLQVEQALRRWDIPFKTVKGIGYWQQQEIYDFYHLLHFLANPESDFYLIALLRSKLFLVPDHVLFHLSQEQGEHYWQKLRGPLQGPYSDAQRAELQRIAERLDKWVQLRDLIPLGDLLRTVLNDLNYRALISAQINGEQLLANIEKFIEHVYRFNKNGLTGLLELIEQLEVLINENVKEGEPQINLDDQSTVKILTIHAAKGLQFPVVFVPYLNTRNLGNVPQSVFLEPEIGLATAFRQEYNQTFKDFCLLNILKLEKNKRELAEAKRIFYVAVTRASEHLFLSARINNREKVQKHSFLEWLMAFAQKYQVDLLDRESGGIEGAGYHLHLVHDYPSEEQEEEQMKHYFEGLDQLQRALEEAPPPDEQALKPYRPLTDQPGPMVFSATRLMTYMEDAKNYYQRYHLGFFESDYQLFAENIYQMDDALVKGKIFHRYLELATQAEQAEEDLLERIFFEFEVFDPLKREQLQSEMSELKKKMYQSEHGRRILQAAEARNELAVMMRLGDDFFTGTIDRIIKTREGLWQVVDYKTNRIAPPAVQEAARKYLWQMKGYALLLSHLFPQQATYPVALYFVHPAALYELRFSMADIEEIKQEFINLIREIKAQYPVGG